MKEFENDLRIVLAHAFEHYPETFMLTTLFSAPHGDRNRVAYEIAVAGEATLRDRMSLPQEVIWNLFIPCRVRQFEEHHHLKAAIVWECLIECANRIGIRALADEIVRQIVEELQTHTASPDDDADIDYSFQTWRWAGPEN